MPFSDHGYLTPATAGGRPLLFGMTQCGGGGPKNASCKGVGDGTDGALPYGSLMYDGAYLYGTTSAGGQYGNGTVFAIPLPD